MLDPRPIPTIGENENPKLNSWRLIVVNSLKSKNGIVEIDAEFVETIFNHKITLTAQDGRKLYVGQFASLCDEYLSFIDEDTGTRCDIQVWYKGLKPSGKVNENRPRSTKDQASSTTNATPTLDAFGIAAKLKTEGLPTPRLRSNYAVSNEQQPLFDNLKSIILQASNNGASTLAQYLVALTDSKIKPLYSFQWTRALTSSLIYDIRNEMRFRFVYRKKISKRPVLQLSDKSDHRNNFEQKSGNQLETKKSNISLDHENAHLEILKLNVKISELEVAWDKAISSTLRQKLSDQLRSAKKKRLRFLQALS